SAGSDGYLLALLPLAVKPVLPTQVREWVHHAVNPVLWAHPHDSDAQTVSPTRLRQAITAALRTGAVALVRIVRSPLQADAEPSHYEDTSAYLPAPLRAV